MIREANIKDAKNIVKLNILEWKNTYKNIFPNAYLDSLDINNEESILKCQNKINEYAICEIDNNVVGMIRYGKNKKGYDDNYAEVYALYVSSNYQKQGVGTKLIDFAFNKLKDNYKYVLISTLKENNANKFYQKIGGKLIGNCNFTLNNQDYLENLYEFKLK